MIGLCWEGKNLQFFFFPFILTRVAFLCRAPNPDNVLIIQTPKGTFSTKSLIQNKKKTCSRLISSNRLKLQEAPIMELNEVEPFSAARCRVYKRPNNKVLLFRITVYACMRRDTSKKMSALDMRSSLDFSVKGTKKF